ncbi:MULTISPECIES: hypothetical protein [Streptomyces]|uniref:hypothetical protein n=1 Tax=Streptomyces TaxID=1883 RepID=UPI001B8087B7|nr:MULTISPECIES: hypothetical protein [Streptomyces]
MGESTGGRSRGLEIAAAVIGAVAVIVAAVIQVYGGNDSDPDAAKPSVPPHGPTASEAPREPSDKGGDADGPSGGSGDTDTISEATGPTNTIAVISADPDSGPPLSRFVVTGSGFQPGEPVRIYYDRDTIDSVSALRDTKANNKGSINVEVQLPDFSRSTLPKTITPWAKGLSSGIEADTVFQVTGCSGHLDCP